MLGVEGFAGQGVRTGVFQTQQTNGTVMQTPKCRDLFCTVGTCRKVPNPTDKLNPVCLWGLVVSAA